MTSGFGSYSPTAPTTSSPTPFPSSSPFFGGTTQSYAISSSVSEWVSLASGSSSSQSLTASSSSSANAGINANLSPDNSTSSYPYYYGGSYSVGPSQLWIKVIIGVSCGVGLLLIALITWCCIRRKRRRKARRESTRLREMDQVGSSMVLPGRRFGGDLTTEEVQSAVVLQPPRLPPRPSYAPAPPPSTRWGSDDSEYDMVATDGSSITRTLSSRSVDTITSRTAPMSVISENPFDHPAYTVRPGRRVDGPLGSATNTSSISPITPQSGSGGTWLHPSHQSHFSPNSSSTRSPYDRPQLSIAHNTFAGSSQASTIQPSPVSQNSRYVPSPAPSYATSHPAISGRTRPVSIISESTDRSEEEEIGTVMSTPGLRRGTTFIQHTDSLSPVGQPSVAAWRDGRRRKEVHLPPSYGEVYGDFA